MENPVAKANILIEALPYIQRLSGKTVIIKYGGNAMIDHEQIKTIMQDITLLKYVGVNPVVVHVGGPEISRTLSLMNVESRFYKGLRITDKDAIEVVQMVLTGKINKDIVAQLNALGGKAIGISGMDGALLQAEKMEPVDGVDLGYVGKVTNVNSRVLEILANDDYIPVVAPIGIGPDGTAYNINADTAASEIAAAMKAEKLIFLTDIDGIYRNPEDPSSLISAISVPEVNELIKQGVISGGMIPKVQGCIKGVEMGVKRTHILNGTIPHPILLEIFTDVGIGTMVTA